jgi:hypothetical protein
MDILLSNKVEEEKHRAKGIGKGIPNVDVIEMSHGDSK